MHRLYSKKYSYYIIIYLQDKIQITLTLPMFSIKVQFQRLVTCIDYTQKSIATTSIIYLQKIYKLL